MRQPQQFAMAITTAMLISSAAAWAQLPLGAVPAANNTAVAAVVNGQPILESALQRALQNVPPAHQAQARGDILNSLIDNILIDQYLFQLRIPVDEKEIQAALENIRQQFKKQNQAFDKVLQDQKIAEVEVRKQIEGELRWEKFAKDRSGEPVLQKFFQDNKDMFDGTRVRARHILLTPASQDPAAHDQIKGQLLAIKKYVEEQATAAMAKLPPNADNLTRAKTRAQALDFAFATQALQKSTCPSKTAGGDLNWFQRSGGMVEPFAKAAFSLKPYEMSDVVHTPYGYHLILVTDRSPGRDVKFEEIKALVRDAYWDRMHYELCTQLRSKARVEIRGAAKP